MDDNQWEPDEEFFLKLSKLPGGEGGELKLGRTSIMEITILNDDGKIHPSFLTLFSSAPPFKESLFNPLSD